MSDTDMQRTPRQHRDAIREQWAKMPANVDAQGHSDLDRFTEAARFARFTEAATPPAEGPPAQVGGMKRNPLQGGSAVGSMPAPAPSTTLGRIRAQAAKHGN